jgi:hypothetical protein
MSQDDFQAILDRLSDAAQDVLIEILEHQGLAVRRQGEWLQLGEFLVRCAANNCKSYPQGWMVQMSFDICPESGADKLISDTNVGIGTTLNDAVVEALTTWMNGVLSPALAVLGMTGVGSDVALYDFRVANVRRDEETCWTLYAGPFQIRGQANDPEALARYLTASPPLKTVLLKPLSDLLSDEQSTLWWIKILLQRLTGNPAIVECKANNKDWPEAMAAMVAFDWPPESEGMLFKQFALIQRGDTGPFQPTTNGLP